MVKTLRWHAKRFDHLFRKQRGDIKSLKLDRVRRVILVEVWGMAGNVSMGEQLKYSPSRLDGL